jgi:putative PIG3 family NAD(P)H quinone oxidoreductase
MEASIEAVLRAIRIRQPGSYDVLELVERPIPTQGPDDLLVRVRAAGVNRADAMQREGTYPTPPGVDYGDVPGLEVAGEVTTIGEAVSEFAVGDRVFGLVQQGGYAEFALVDRGLALPMPAGWSFAEAAAVIEAAATANETVFTIGGLTAGEAILIHAAGSGVGSTAVQMAVAAGARVIASAGSETKLERLGALGAALAINYRKQDFVSEAMRFTGDGVDLVLDFIGPDYLARNLAVLRRTGRLVLAGQLGGPTCVFDPAAVIAKRLTIRGFTLRPQSLAEKRDIVERLRRRWLPKFESGRIKPILQDSFPLAEAAAAHRLMETNQTFGKIVLEVA